jgi:hypothetical protein
VPIDSRSRPIGVTILSLIAFVASPVCIVLLGLSFYSIFISNTRPLLPEDLAGWVWLCFWLTLITACSFTLAWIAFAAGVELWRMKSRGRRLASASMILFFLLGIVYLLFRETWWTVLGVGICCLSAFFFVYLQLPSINQSFNSSPPELPG